MCNKRANTPVGFVHINDRLALLEIARQLDVEEELGEHISVFMNNVVCFSN